jgi:hypothetical protein
MDGELKKRTDEAVAQCWNYSDSLVQQQRQGFSAPLPSISLPFQIF